MSTAIVSQTVYHALVALRREDGTILPADVVEAARDEASPLHSRFTWDDGEAAHQYRIWEARMLLRVTVTMLPNCDRPVRAFVSLSSEEGYRPMISVLANSTQRGQMIADAKRDMEIFVQKYRHLSQLKEVVGYISRKAAEL